MTDHEKEILDKIKQSTEKTPVPESLAPDQIMKMLEEHNSTQASGHILKKHGFFHGHRMRGGLIAAALVLVVGIGAHIRQQNLSSDSATSSTKGSFSIGTSSGKLASSDTLETATDYDEIYTYLQSYQDELDSSSVTGSTDSGIVMYSTKTPTEVHAPIVPAPLQIQQQPLHELWILHFPIPTSAQRASVKQTL